MAPWFRELAARGDFALHVVFLRHLDQVEQGVGFGTPFVWDLPLLEGYSSESLQLPKGNKAMVTGYRKLSAAIHAHRSDVVVVTGWNEPLLMCAMWVACRSRARLLIRGESNDLRQRGAFTRLAHRMILRLADGFLSIGAANRRFYLNNGVPAERIFEGAYFVETERMLAMYDAHRADREQLRAELGIAPDDTVLLFCGKHVAFKRPIWLVEAAAALRTKSPTVSVLYAGSGELTETLKSRAKALGVPAHFTGFLNQTELWRAYLTADIFVLPSTSGETWGLVTNEAMLFGLPVLVCDEVGCRADLVIDGETGYGFAPSVEALTEKAQLLVSDAALRSRLGAAGRKRVVEKYSAHVATRGLLAAINALAV
jgi:glycosyltransferase involved in cell wall biosynthesis